MESMGLNWDFQRGGEIQTKKPASEGYGFFSGTICTFRITQNFEGNKKKNVRVIENLSYQG